MIFIHIWLRNLWPKMAVQIKHMAEQIRCEDSSFLQCHTQSTDQLLPMFEESWHLHTQRNVVQEWSHHNPSKWNYLLVNMT